MIDYVLTYSLNFIHKLFINDKLNLKMSMKIIHDCI